MIVTDGDNFTAHIPFPTPEQQLTRWQQLHDGAHLPAHRGLPGWRVWRIVVHDGMYGLEATRPFRSQRGHTLLESTAAICDPTTPDRYTTDRNEHAVNAARSSRRKLQAAPAAHTAPHPQCVCGTCMVRLLSRLVTYISTFPWARPPYTVYHHPTPARASEPWLLDEWHYPLGPRLDHPLQQLAEQHPKLTVAIPTVVACRGYGKVAHGMDLDPTGTARVQYLIAHTLILPTGFEHLAHDMRAKGFPVAGCAQLNHLQRTQ